jgi:hypothetical protein
LSISGLLIGISNSGVWKSYTLKTTFHGKAMFSNIRVLSDSYINRLKSFTTTKRKENRVKEYAAQLPESDPLRTIIARWFLKIMSMQLKNEFYVALVELGIVADRSLTLYELKLFTLGVPGLVFSDDPSVASSINPFRMENMQSKEKQAALVKESITVSLASLSADPSIDVPGYVNLIYSPDYYCTIRHRSQVQSSITWLMSRDIMMPWRE